jgi:transcriptional regulator with XRE-family HTH domain
MEKTEQTQMNPREKFQSARKSMGMNQSDFAKALGVSQGLISLIESGRTPVSKKVTERLSQLEKEADASAQKAEQALVQLTESIG